MGGSRHWNRFGKASPPAQNTICEPHKIFDCRSHLLSAQQQLQEELSQTQQVIRSYHSLGEEFTLLTQQYKQLREEIENRQWALTELSKPHGSKR